MEEQNSIKWPGFLNQAFVIMVNATTAFSLNPYALLIIMATIFYGLNINIIKKYLSDVNSLHISTVAVSFAGILGLLFLFISGYEPYIEVDRKQVLPLLSLIALGVLGTALAQYIQNQLIQRSSVIFASSTTYMIPIIAVLWGVLDGEKLGLLHYLGMSGILMDVLVLNRSAKIISFTSSLAKKMDSTKFQ